VVAQLALTRYSQLYKYQRCEDGARIARAAGELPLFRYAEFSTYSIGQQVVKLACEQVRLRTPCSEWHFVELGSHLGKNLFTAALNEGLGTCLGIDPVQQLVAIAEQVQVDYEASVPLYDFNARLRTAVTFLHGDPLNSKALWADATVVLVVTTCFSLQDMKRLAWLANKMAIGSVLATCTKALDSTLFVVSATLPVDMNWGSTTVYFHTKVAIEPLSLGDIIHLPQ